MSGYAMLRVLGYLVIIIMHISNILYMRSIYKKNPSEDENVKRFKDLEYRFFTTWTFILQTVYAVFGLLCDFWILKNAHIKNYRLPDTISVCREIIFAGLLWPCSMVVFTVFWGVYIYDRALIFPDFLDAVIPPISNHVIHTMIVPVALWEVLTRPRKEPENHAKSIAQLTMHLCVYMSVLSFTYFERGIWLYPIFRKLYGTIYFYIALGAITSLFYIFYYLQWPLTNWIHASKRKVEKKKTKAEKKKVK